MRLNGTISGVELWIFNHYRIVHASRISLAFIIMLYITQMMSIPESTWPLITLVVVMGPISYWGNVLPRALQRVFGTCAGAASGMVALYLEQYSTAAFLLWCSIIMFLSGYLALGSRPYAGLLIGITLCVILGADKGDFSTALWRSGDVIFGSISAIVFCSILPQKAFIHWRLKVSEHLAELSLIHKALFSENLLQRPKMRDKQKLLLANIIRNRGLLTACVAETGLAMSLLSSIQSSMVNCLQTMDKLADTYWLGRSSHFTLINAKALKRSHLAIEDMLLQLSRILKTGVVEGEESQFNDNSEIIKELQLLAQQYQVQSRMSLYGYVWLNLQLVEELSHLRRMLLLSLNLTNKPVNPR